MCCLELETWERAYVVKATPLPTSRMSRSAHVRYGAAAEVSVWAPVIFQLLSRYTPVMFSVAANRTFFLQWMASAIFEPVILPLDLYAV